MPLSDWRETYREDEEVRGFKTTYNQVVYQLYQIDDDNYTHYPQQRPMFCLYEDKSVRARDSDTYRVPEVFELLSLHFLTLRSYKQLDLKSRIQKSVTRNGVVRWKVQ